MGVQIPEASQGLVLELLGPAFCMTFLSLSHLTDEETEACRST